MNKLKQEEQAKIIKVVEPYEFIRDVTDADIAALNRIIRNDDNPTAAYSFARDLGGADIEKLKSMVMDGEHDETVNAWRDKYVMKNLLDAPWRTKLNRTLDASSMRDIIQRGDEHDALEFAQEAQYKIGQDGYEWLDMKALESVVVNGNNVAAATMFAQNIQGSNTEALEQIIIKSGNIGDICWFAQRIVDSDTNRLEQALIQKVAQTDRANMPAAMHQVLQFGQHVHGANTQALGDLVVQYGSGMDMFGFAFDVPNANIKQLERGVVESKDPLAAYMFAKEIEGADLNALEKVVLESNNPLEAVSFAALPAMAGRTKDLELMVIKNCAEHHPEVLYQFALLDLEGTDIKAIETALIQHPDKGAAQSAYKFARDIEGADIESLERVVMASGDQTLMNFWKKDIAQTNEPEPETNSGWFGMMGWGR